MKNDNVGSKGLGSSLPVMIDERYKAALESHNNEFRTLGERARIFALVQSILISASVLILINQQIFGYLFPYLFSGVVFIGALFCLLHFGAGQMGAYSAFTWRQYMRSIEQNQPDMPWAWFYAKYQEKYGNKRALEKLPLPSNWLYPPTIFISIWLIASAYIPSRIMIDETFAVASIRPLAFVLSIIAGVVVLGILCWLYYSATTYSITLLISKRKEVSDMATKEKAQKSASDIAIMADYISKALTLDYPPQVLKVILDVPMKQLEDELQTLKIYVQALR